MYKKLWAAVLVQALRDLKSKRHNGSEVYWFFRSKEDGPGSLQWICQALEIDIAYVRAQAIKLHRKCNNLLVA